MRLLLGAAEGQRLTDIAQILGLTKATTHRLLVTLESEGMVRRDRVSGRYRANPAMAVSMPAAVGTILSVRATVEDSLRELAESVGATAVLAFPDQTGRNVVSGAYALPPQPLRLDPSALPPIPAYAIAPGKCLLAAMSDEELQKLLAGRLPRVTRFTITSRKAVMEQLAQVRRQGYAVCEQEALIGFCGLAVPVRDHAGVAVASLALGTTGHTLPRSRVRQWLPPLRAAAASVSELLYDAPRRDN